MSLDIGNVVRVSVSGPERGLANINTSALAIITDEAPIPGDFGVSRTYLNPDGVAEDFGTSSETFRLALAVFNQKLNILTGKGFLVVIPRLQSAPAAAAVIIGTGPVNLLALTAADYNLNVDVDGGGAADVLIGPVDTTSLATAEASLNSTAITSAGLEFVLSGELSAALITLQTLATGVAKTIVIDAAGTGTDIAPPLGLEGSATGADAGVERAKDAILRTKGSVNYFGIVYNEKMADAVLTELTATVQSLDKFQAVGSNLTADIAGVFTTIANSGYTKTRCMIYTNSENDSLDFAAGYMSRLMSIDFNSTGTSLTMNLKDFIGLVGDSGMTQTLLDAAQKAGVDFIADFGIPKIYTSGANLFSDQVYTRLALKVDLQIAGFNYLAQTTTKIPQTETGMDGLKGTYRSVMKRYVGVGVFAPGEWTGSTRFGNPADHDRNIEEFGFFIYSLPVSQQAQSVRTARVAPAVQIAGKESGALHSSDVVVLVEP
jgi:hypothetical protein